MASFTPGDPTSTVVWDKESLSVAITVVLTQSHLSASLQNWYLLVCSSLLSPLSSPLSLLPSPLSLPHRFHSLPDLYADGGFTDFAAGEHHNLVLTKKSRIFVWGRNEDGQLGLGHDADVPVPTLLPNPDEKIPARVYCGAHFSVILTDDGSVFTMGYNDKGQLGYGKPHQSNSVPKKVEIPEPVEEVTCVWSSVLVITRSRKIYGWGNNGDLQIQLDVHPLVLSPTAVPSFDGYVSYAGGINHVMGLRDGSVYTWGRNYFGQLGRDRNVKINLQPLNRPFLVLGSCQSVACGSYNSFALMKDGSLWSWGNNPKGELGIGTTSQTMLPQKVTLPNAETRVASYGVSSHNSFFVSEEGDLYIWGSGKDGTLGMGSTELTPKLVPTLLQNWKWELPREYIWAKWKSVFQWLFLGRLDLNSPFHKLLVEIIFNFLSVC
jgi:alpha-tubulin suppressor-like RCC1 family protein